MGYTHYWRGTESQINEAAWPQAVKDAQLLVDAGKLPFELDLSAAEPGWIKFNGNADKDHDHEDFWVPLDPDAIKSSAFEFCKTAEKPYDTVVTAVLAVLGAAGLKVSSDGDSSDWEPGLAFAKKVLGRDVPYPCAQSED